MAAAKQTVASTNARIDELVALVQEQSDTISMLQTQLQAVESAPVAPQQPADSELYWVSDNFAKVAMSAKGNRWATFTGRTGEMDQDTGKRSYGEYKTFKVFEAELVDVVEEMLQGDNRLVAITATPKSRDYQGKTYTDYVVDTLRVIARPTPQVEAAPVTEEIAF